MSVANLSRWANATSLTKKSGSQSHNGSQTSLVSATSDLSLAGDDSMNSEDAGDFGTLIIVIMKAKNLYNRRAISKQNPYCSVRVAKHSDRTKAITRGGQAPLWDHETRFKLNSEDDNRQLKLCVFDQNGSSTEIIGDALVPLKPAYEAPTDVGYDNWFPIHFNKRYVGEVYLEITFYPKRKGSQRSSRRSSQISQISHVSQSGPSIAPKLAQNFPQRTTNSLYSNPGINLSNPCIASSDILSSTPNANPQHSSIYPSVGVSSSSGTRLHHPSLPTPPPHASSVSLSMKHSESMPILRDSAFSDPVSRTPSPPLPGIRRSARPLPRVPQPEMPSHHQSQAQTQNQNQNPVWAAQEDIQRQINDGYGASLLERLKPSAS